MNPAVRAQLGDRTHINQRIKKDADVLLQDLCIVPFKKYAKKKIPYIVVSGESFPMVSCFIYNVA